MLCATVLVKLLPAAADAAADAVAVTEMSKTKGETLMGTTRVSMLGEGMGREVKRGTGTTKKKRGREGDILMEAETKRDVTMRDEIVQCVECLLPPIINRRINNQINPQDNNEPKSADNDNGIVVNNTTTNVKQKQKKHGKAANTKTKAVRLLARLRAKLTSSQISQSKRPRSANYPSQYLPIV